MIDFEDSFTPDIHVVGILSPMHIWQTVFYLNRDSRFRFQKLQQNFIYQIRKSQTNEFLCYRHREGFQDFYLISNHSLSSEAPQDEFSSQLFPVEEVQPLIKKLKNVHAWLVWETQGSTTLNIQESVSKTEMPIKVYLPKDNEIEILSGLASVIDLC
jgi:hypothetical protein